MENVLLVINIPTPYRIPLFNALAQQLESYDMRLVVAFGAMGYERRKFELNVDDFDFSYFVLETKNIRYRNEEKVSFTYDGLYKVIREVDPQVIVLTGFSIATIKVWIRALFRKTRFVIWCGAIDHREAGISRLRTVLRRILVTRAKSYITYGKLAKNYLSSLGASRDKIFIGINTVDTEYFSSETERLRNTGTSDRQIKNLLCVSYLTQRKQVEALLPIVRELSTKRRDFRLEILGDGPEKQRLQGMADSMGISDFVHFGGHVQMNDLPGYFSEASIFLLPTKYDIWGLTLVEAMAAGLVCIASRNAGAANDLIEQGVTGYSESFENASRVAEMIDWLLDHEDAAESIGKAAAEYIENNVSIDISAAGFVKAIRYAAEN